MSGGGDDNDMSATAWPGFVDILSSVLIMFVFFVMVISSALFFHVIIYKAKVLSGESQVATVSQINDTVKTFEAKFAKSKFQRVKLPEENGNEIVIFFGGDSISVEKDAFDTSKTFLENYFKGKDPSKYHILVTASRSPEQYETVARKIAVARMLNTRNVVLDAFSNPDLIYPEVIAGELIDESYDWVKITIEKE